MKYRIPALPSQAKTQENTMYNCEHFEGQIFNGRELAHSAKTEEQICFGLQLKPEELVSWVKANSPSGSLTEEALVFLILHYRASGSSLLVESLAANLDKRMRARTDSYAGLLGVPASRELCAEVVSLAWIHILKIPIGRGVWAQICCRRFLRNLLRDELRRSRQFDAISLDSDEGALAVKVVSHNSSPEDLVYAKEILSQLKPRQRQAFVLQHGFGEPQREIARAFGRSDRSVRTWLRQIERRLNAST
jgi:DNA-directed RNA polymerase specialized sigma24 family protein